VQQVSSLIERFMKLFLPAHINITEHPG
jgi:hypothetical protein